MLMIDDAERRAFQQTVWDYYHDHGRHDLPWREEGEKGFEPYRIFLSEIMLQQTQVSRVIVKYREFLEKFPMLESLADAPQGEVLRAWSGLGYNRRAKYLWQAAQQLMREYDGVFPSDKSELIKLPGIGANTAGAILAYAFNQPAVFIETNIRTVFIHHFFEDQTGVSDKAVRELVEQTLDDEQPREWYWALMDYGAHLKQTVGNLSRHSKAYARQPAFAGSRRQIRGQVLRKLADGPKTAAELRQAISDERLMAVLQELAREELISRSGRKFHL